MRLPLGRLSSSFVSFRFACGLGIALAVTGGMQAQVQVPLPQVLSEADGNIKAGKSADAVYLLEGVLARVAKGETLPAGVNLASVQLLVANTHFQLQAYSKAAEAAEKLLATTKTGQIAADARLVLGLSLALQQKFAEAVPVFQALEENTVHREKALMYRSMAAQQAGQPEVAIDALNRLLATAPRDADWADSALTLIALQLQQKNLEAAARGLALLRGNFSTVDNLAGLNVLSLQLGDTLLAANDLSGALTAYRTVLPRNELLRLQKQRTSRMETQLARQKTLARTSVADTDALRRLEARIKATKEALDEIGKRGDYDATLFYRLGNTFLQRGGVWEAAIALERLLKEFPQSKEREQASLELVRAYADSGRIERMKTAG
jgi:tetratricopeptide (TPR) repeat protein